MVPIINIIMFLCFTGNLEKTIELNKRDFNKKDKTITDLKAKIAELEKTIEQQNKEISELEGKSWKLVSTLQIIFDSSFYQNIQ